MLLAGMSLLDNRIAAHSVVQESPFFASTSETVLPVGLDVGAPFIGALATLRKELTYNNEAERPLSWQSQQKGRNSMNGPSYDGSGGGDTNMAYDVGSVNGKLASGAMDLPQDAERSAGSDRKMPPAATGASATNVKHLRISRA
jgi:hypothetical protein